MQGLGHGRTGVAEPMGVKLNIILETKQMAYKRVEVTQESDTGRNQRFHDNRTGADMTRAQFVLQIEQGNYRNYHVRKINGIKTPASNPDGREGSNLD